jgi:APA family basic amino acid/polyamine antiporter
LPWPALTLALWAACGTIVLAGALTFGELASRYPQAGGPYVYLREGWGPRVAFLYGWQALLVMDPAITAALATGSAEYIVALGPSLAGTERWIAVAIVWALAAINMLGLRLSARVFDAMTGLKVLALGGVVAVAFGAGHGDWSRFQTHAAATGAPPLGEGLAIGLVSAFFSFAGFWEASRIAGEIRDASRTLPRAFAAGVAAITAIYVATTAAFIYLVPAGSTATGSEFARRAGEAMLGQAGPAVLAGAVVLSVVASAMALLMMAPRLYVAMSEDGLFPAALAARHPRTDVPARATLLLAALATVYIAAGTFEQISSFLVSTAMGFIALAAAALFPIRRRRPDAGGFRVPGYPATPIVFVVLISAVVLIVAMNRPRQALLGFAIVALGWPAYGLAARRGVE